MCAVSVASAAMRHSWSKPSGMVHTQRRNCSSWRRFSAHQGWERRRTCQQVWHSAALLSSSTDLFIGVQHNPCAALACYKEYYCLMPLEQTYVYSAWDYSTLSSVKSMRSHQLLQIGIVDGLGAGTSAEHDKTSVLEVIVLACAGLFDHPPWREQVSMQARRQESETIIFTCVKDLLYKCKVDPSEVRTSSHLSISLLSRRSLAENHFGYS